MVFHIAIAFVIALISGLGIGGGGLFTVYLSLFTDLPQLTVQGINLLFFLFSSGASVTVQLFRKRVLFYAVGIMIVTGLVGASVGTLIATALPESWLRRIFGMMLVACGIVSLQRSQGKPQKMTNEK